MTIQELNKKFSILGINDRMNLAVITQLDKQHEAALKETISQNGSVLFYDDIEKDFLASMENLYNNNGYILFTGSDYARCSALHYAETKAVLKDKKPCTNFTSDDFYMIGQAFEYRYWGDSSAVSIKLIENDLYKLVDLKLLVDFAKDWMFKNRTPEN